MATAAVRLEIVKNFIDVYTDIHGFMDKLNPEWRSCGHNWGRAIWTECAELMENFNWQWWKLTPKTNYNQVLTELVDIYVFMVCGLEDNDGSFVMEAIDELLEGHESQCDKAYEPCNVYILIETIVSDCLDEGSVLPGFRYLGKLVGMLGFDIRTFLRAVKGKLILNQFRQDNGYKEGNYKKMWFGKEDNDVLYEFINSDFVKGTTLDSFNESVLNLLQTEYYKVINKCAV